MDFVLDNSVVIAWGLNEESAYADNVLGMLAHHQPVVPSVWSLEFANVLVMAERKGRISASDVGRIRSLVLALGIEVIPEPKGRIFNEVLDLARAESLSSYGASYLDLALRLGSPIATLDMRLREVAHRRGVDIFGAN